MNDKHFLPAGRYLFKARRLLLGVACFLLTVSAHAQTGGSQEKMLKGTVKDASGQPLPGVSVIIQGTKKGTQTDFDGNYVIKVKNSDTLVFSMVGMQKQTVDITQKILNSSDLLNTVLKEAAEQLEGTVLVGYTQQKKSTATASITQVKAEEMGQAVYTEISNSLQGLAPGVWFNQNSGFPGAQSSIRIRGAGGDPLFLIDGFISQRADFDALSPDEIENITILRDIASTAQYGVRGSNGVVLVTTKSGGEPRFTYRAGYGFGDRIGRSMDWGVEDELRYANNMTKYKDARFNIERASGVAERKTPPLYNAEAQALAKKRGRYDIDDYIWKGSTRKTHNISARGASKNQKIKYFLLGGIRSDDGPYVNTGSNRVNMRSKVNVQLTEDLSVNLNVSYEERNRDRFFWTYDGGGLGNTTLADFYRSTRKLSKIHPLYVDKNGNPLPSGTRSKFPTTDQNSINWHPVELVENGGYRRAKGRGLRTMLNFTYNFPFLKGLKAVFGYDSRFRGVRGKDMIVHNKFYKLVPKPGKALEFEKPGPSNATSHALGYARERLAHSFNEQYWDFYRFQMTYARNFLGKHDVSASFIYEQNLNNYKYHNTSQEGLLTREVDQIFGTSNDNQRRWSSGGEFSSGRVSQLGTFSYIYDQKYSLTSTVRRDGSNNFAPGKRFGIFYSVGGAWTISKESFLQNLSFLDLLKIRASYGTTGNDGGVGRFAYQQTYSNASSFVFGDTYQRGIRASTPPNKDITWSTSTSWNAGIDFDILKSKIFGNFDIFNVRDAGILGRRIASVPTTYGTSFAAENYRENERNGFEVQLGTKGNVQGLEYTVTANMGYAVDKILVLDEAEKIPAYRSRIGKPGSRLWGYRAKGIIRTQAEADALNKKGFKQFGRKILPGTILYEDVRGEDGKEGADGKVDGNDQEYISDNATPRINYGIVVNLKYKGAFLNARFSGVGAYDKMVRTMNTSSGGVFSYANAPYFSIWTDHWSKETPNATYPAPSGIWGQAETGHAPSTFWMRNGAFFRMKALDIGYTVPQEYLKNIFVKGLTLSGSATNLFVISGMKELEGDPEQNSLDSFPIFRTYNLNLIVNF